MSEHCDVLIAGGGMVGASLACALAGRGLDIDLVEAVPWGSAEHPGYDDRTLALAYGTRRIFEGLGLWAAIAGSANPIRRVHVSDRGRFGQTVLDAGEERVDALGYVAAARAVGAALSARLAGLEGVQVHCPARLDTIVVAGDAARAELLVEGGRRSVSARLVVAADGARSRVREQLGIPAIRWDYGQHAVIANVTPRRPHGDVAYERFTETGPLALLPMTEGRCAVVRTVRSQDVDRLMALDEGGFLADLEHRFGGRLGGFARAGRRQAHPLYLVKSRQHSRHRVAVIGNAAHTLHPIAGQGFNLGMRDVAALAEVVAGAVAAGRDPGEADILERYAGWRRWDQRRIVALTDGLERLFTNPLPPLRWLRDAGLAGLDLLPPIKHLLARETMGLSGRLPRLARGVPLGEVGREA